MKTRTTFFALTVMVSLLLLASLACAQAGEILTVEEATQRAIDARHAEQEEDAQAAEGAEFKAGDKIELTSAGSIPIYSKPAGRAPFINAPTGKEGVVRESTIVNDEVWYRVESTAGNGWIQAQFIAAPSAAEEEIVFAVGDKAILTGTTYLITLYREAGSKLMVAGQEKGVQVEVLEVAEVGAEMWYKIDSPTGQGWVPAFNLAPIEE